MKSAVNPVYSEKDVVIRYKGVELYWRAAGEIVKKGIWLLDTNNKGEIMSI